MQPNDLSDRTSSTISPKTAESLRQALQELECRHKLGESNLCESILAKCPELCQSREAVLELIYLEFVLSQEANRPISAEALQLRFPEYQADLQKILSIDHVFRDQADTPNPTDSTIGSQSKIGQATRHDRKIQFDQLGDYELLEIIGHGGMGVVYRARQQRLNRFVAVKTIDMLSSLNPATVARFHNEAELVAKLQHPNIVQIYEVASIQGVPYFSMELVSGGTLAQATQERPFVPVTAAKIVETLARAVHYAHSQSVVHRDLKPANILLSPSDRSQAIEVPVVTQMAMLDSQPLSTGCEPKIADFGLAKFLEGALDRTATGTAMIGTPSYMAPEQIDPALGPIGPACDIYALGAILYNAMTGSPPFIAATVIETIQQVRTAEVVPPSRLQTKIPRDLETICLKCLRKDPVKRYLTANELADDLQRFLIGQPILARPAGLVERNWKWARRHPSLTAFLAAVFLAAIGMTFLWLRSEHSRRGEQAALERNDQLLYDRDIALAQFEYDSNRIFSSREILEKTRPEFRGWEWDYLRHQSAASVWKSTEQLDPIQDLDISPDAGTIAWVSREARQDFESITVWDVANDKLRWRLKSEHPCEFTDVRFSSDGNLLLSASKEVTKADKREGDVTSDSKGSVAVWDLRTGALLRNIPVPSSLSRFDKSGNAIFVGQWNDCVTKYSVDSGEVLLRYRNQENPNQVFRIFPYGNAVTDFDLQPNGSQIAVVTRGTGITLWDAETGKRNQEINHRDRFGKSIGLRCVDWSPDGQRLSVSDDYGSQYLYGLDKGQFRLTKEHHYDAPTYGRFTPDGRRYVSIVYGQPIEIRALPSGELEKSIAAHNGKTHAISLDSTGRFMVTGGADNRVHMWDLSIDDPRSVVSSTTGFLVHAFDFSPASKHIALALSHQSNFKKNPRLEIRDVESHRLKGELLGHTEAPTSVAYSADGNRLLSGSIDKSVRLWEPSTSRELSVLTGHKAPISAVAFMQETNSAASIDEDGALKIWNLESKSIARSYKLCTRIVSSSFHPLRPLIVIASKENGASIWDLLQGKQLATVPASKDVEKVTFSPDGLRLATVGNEPTTTVWLLEDLLRREQATPEVKLVGHSGTISSVSFSPDGKRLISCSQDETVRLFDLVGGRELIRFNSVQGSDGLVRFSPDGKSIFATIVGDLRTWKSVVANCSVSQSSTKSSMISWHRSEAAAAEKTQNWFAAHFHQDHLVQLEPENTAHLLKRANLRILLGDLAGAEDDLCYCEGNLEKTDTVRLLTDLARVYLGQQEWNEYEDVCIRLLKECGDSTTPAELNACVWFCGLNSRSKLDTAETVQKFEELLQNPRFREINYLNTVALAHYRDGEYLKAITCAQASAKKTALTRTRLPIESMILALAYAQQDQQRIGWLPRMIRQFVRHWGLSATWKSSLDEMAKVDGWLLENEGLKTSPLNEDIYMIYSVDLPQLRKEWEEIANAQ